MSLLVSGLSAVWAGESTLIVTNNPKIPRLRIAPSEFWFDCNAESGKARMSPLCDPPAHGRCAGRSRFFPDDLALGRGKRANRDRRQIRRENQFSAPFQAPPHHHSLIAYNFEGAALPDALDQWNDQLPPASEDSLIPVE